MRFTPELLQRAATSFNAIKEREVNLRGYKASTIENFGVLQDQFDSIDISDNEVRKLDNFPRMQRLTMLLANNNHISKVSARLGDQLVNLKSLVLTNNNIDHLSEIVHIATVSKLESLSLLENPITQKLHYRLFVIHHIPTLRFLDFQRIRMKERQAAAKFFGDAEGKLLLAAVKEEGEAREKKSEGKKIILTEEQKRQITAAIEAATTREEVDAIERQLKAGTFKFT